MVLKITGLSFLLPVIFAISLLIVLGIMFFHVHNKKISGIKRKTDIMDSCLEGIESFEEIESLDEIPQEADQTEDSSQKEKITNLAIFSVVIILINSVFVSLYLKQSSISPRTDYLTKAVGSEAEYSNLTVDVAKTPVNIPYKSPKLLTGEINYNQQAELTVLAKHKISGVVVEKDNEYSYAEGNIPELKMLLAWGDMANDEEKIKAITQTLRNASITLDRIREENKNISIDKDNAAYGLVTYLSGDFLTEMSGFYNTMADAVEKNPELKNDDVKNHMNLYKIVPSNQKLLAQLQNLSPESKVLLQGYIAQINASNDKIFYVTNFKKE